MKFFLFAILVLFVLLGVFVVTCADVEDDTPLPDEPCPAHDEPGPSTPTYLKKRGLTTGPGGRFASVDPKRGSTKTNVTYVLPDVEHTPHRHHAVTRHISEEHRIPPESNIHVTYVDIPELAALQRRPFSLTVLFLLDHAMRALHNMGVRYRVHVAKGGKPDKFGGSTLRYMTSLCARFCEFTGLSRTSFYKYYKDLVEMNGMKDAVERYMSAKVRFGGSEPILSARYHNHSKSPYMRRLRVIKSDTMIIFTISVNYSTDGHTLFTCQGGGPMSEHANIRGQNQSGIFGDWPHYIVQFFTNRIKRSCILTYIGASSKSKKNHGKVFQRS